MKARRLLLALCAVSTALAAREPDWFDAFKGKAFLQGDTSLVAREKAAAPDTPPLFFARWVVLRYAGFTEKERRFWPSRNMLLVTMPSGTRYVLESSLGFVDESHLDEDRPWQRVATSRAAFEVWSSPGESSPPDVSGAAPCEGSRARVRAPGGALEFFVDDLGSRTVRAALAELATGTFDEDERRDLGTLLKVSVDTNRAVGTEFPTYQLRDPLFAVFVALRDQVLPPEKRTAVFAPDLAANAALLPPAAPPDLSSWRALAHLPLDLPPFPPLPPEAEFK